MPGTKAERKANRRHAKKERHRKRRQQTKDRRKLPYYIATCLVAAGGVAWFSFAPSTLSYWLGGVLATFPFVFLVADRSMERGYQFPPDYGHDDGPWSGP
jgi:predicted MFS family arabinose efflux permease